MIRHEQGANYAGFRVETYEQISQLQLGKHRESGKTDGGRCAETLHRVSYSASIFMPSNTRPKTRMNPNRLVPDDIGLNSRILVIKGAIYPGRAYTAEKK